MRNHQSVPSASLPRNFIYQSQDMNGPRTPESRELSDFVPTTPHRQHSMHDEFSHLLHHPRPRRAFRDRILLPNVETTSFGLPFVPGLQYLTTESAPSTLAAASTQNSSPKTPLAQMFDSQRRLASPAKISRRSTIDIPRPMSSSSNDSNSSGSTDDSLASEQSLGGSLTSYDSESQDPFYLTVPSPTKSNMICPPVSPAPKSPRNNRQKRQKPKFTEEMDEHIMTTYARYLQDPRYTPFKVAPGSTPPIGVLYRVAREAKRTWPKARKSSGRGRLSHAKFNRAVTPIDDAHNESHEAITSQISDPSLHASDESTPRASRVANQKTWPRSDAATRRRFRELCKQRPTIPTHYQRLLRSRSPSPFSFSRGLRAASTHPTDLVHQNDGFSTRSMRVSLAAETMPFMQHDNPLAQQAPGGADSWYAQRDDQWFNCPVKKTRPLYKSQSSQTDLDIDDARSQAARLGSPFQYHTWSPRGHVRGGISRPTTPVDQIIDLSSQNAARFSPPHLQPLTGLLKRRAQHQLEEELSPGGSAIGSPQHGAFPVDINFGKSSHRRVRSRGFSLNNVDRLRQTSNIFSEALTYDKPIQQGHREITPPGPAVPADSGLRSSLDNPKRLGSPFRLIGNTSIHSGPSSRRTVSDAFMDAPPSPPLPADTRKFSTIRRSARFQMPGPFPGPSSIDEVLHNSISCNDSLSSTFGIPPNEMQK
ncbi:MAG: hypothetical protein M1834_008262 [Cirrosporium novae-zelandiae]|nr:MAG: hypothetical protein M1834_008262 [Cirrosporium novae-zelandiae]